MTYVREYDGLCPYIFSHLNIGIMLYTSQIDSIVLEYSEERDRMLAVVTVGSTKYKCYSVHINKLTGLLCMTGICSRIG